MRFRLIIVALTAALLAIVGVPAAQGSSASELIVASSSLNAATDVVNGTVVAVQSVDTGLEVHTVALVRVEQTIQGGLSGDVRVSVPGGTMNNGNTVTVSHMPYFRVGDELQLSLLLASGAYTDRVAPGQDLYAVVDGINGAAAISGSIVSQAEAATDFSLTGVKWDPTDASRWPIPYSINTSGSGLSSTATRNALLEAAGEWVADPGSDIEFVTPGTTSASPDVFNDGINTVGWTAAAPGQNYLAQAIWVSSGGRTLSFDIRFNTAYTWTHGPSGGFDIETVQLHELGHVLGLNHIQGTPEAIDQVMYPSVGANTVKGLGDGDRGGAAAMYPAANPPGSGDEGDDGLCDGLQPTIDMNTNGGNGTGTAGDDVILGTPGDDVIDGLGGNDTICGRSGDDQIKGGEGADRIFAGDGADRVWGQGAADTIDGDGGNDLIIGGDGNDVLRGGDDDDAMRGDDGTDTMMGGDGRDRLWGGDDADTMDGGDGIDTLQGMRGDDELTGGPGNDVLLGQGGNDRLWGEDGNDAVAGGNDDDEGWGGNGHDRVWGQNGNDMSDGGDGNDLVHGGEGDNMLFGRNGHDRIVGGSGIDRAWGGAGIDRFWGGDGNDDLRGEAGDDRIFGQGGNADRCDGGPDTDISTTCETKLNFP